MCSIIREPCYLFGPGCKDMNKTAGLACTLLQFMHSVALKFCIVWVSDFVAQLVVACCY